MASMSNKARLTIRKRAAPNFLAKKVKIEPKVDGDIEPVIVQRDIDSFNSLEVEKTLEPLCSEKNVSKNEGLSMFPSPTDSLDSAGMESSISLPGVITSSEKCKLNSFLEGETTQLDKLSEIGQGTLPLPLDNETRKNTQNECENSQNTDSDANPLTISPSLAGFKELKKRCAPILPKNLQLSNVNLSLCALKNERSLSNTGGVVLDVTNNNDTSSEALSLNVVENISEGDENFVISGLHKNKVNENEDIKISGDIIDTPVCNGSAEILNKDNKSKDAIKRGHSKLLSKRALPVLHRKRSTPNLSSLSQGNTVNLVNEELNVTSTKNNETVTHTCNSFSIKEHEQKLQVSDDYSKEHSNIHLNETCEPLKILKNLCLLSESDLKLKTVESPEKSSDDNSQQQSVSQIKAVFENIGSNHTDKKLNDASNNLNKIAGQKCLKRRLGPKLVSKKTAKVPKICTNFNVKGDGSVDVDTNLFIPSSLQNVDENKLENTNKNMNSLLNSTDNASGDLIRKDENHGSIGLLDGTSESGACSSNQETTEGVLRVFLNCWPQYPLDNLSEDPFYEGQKIEDLGKVSVFINKNHRVAYCDLKSVVDFKKVPKNWAFVNFNKLIKEEFVSPEDEGMQNDVSNYEYQQCQIHQEKIDDLLSVAECSDLLYNDTHESDLPFESDIDLSARHTFQIENYEESVVNGPPLLKSVSTVSSKSDHSGELLISEKSIPDQLKADNYKCNITEVPSNKADTINEDHTHLVKVSGDKEDVSVTESPESDVCKKPYKLRLKKPLVCKNGGNLEHLKDEKVEDIFSNSEDSDGSVYKVELENKNKSTKKRKKNENKQKRKRVKKDNVKKKERKPHKKYDSSSKEKKPKIKDEKKVKKPSLDPSPFKKLGMEVKNKNKWDEEGNCPEPDKLELKDFIFYVPKNEPMSQEVKKETNINVNEEKEPEESKEEEEEEENHGPKLIVKDGKIIVDPNSTRIKQTPVVHAKVEKVEKPKEPNDPWELQETMRFYATLWKYGIDFSMLAGTFPKKSRDSIKKKFNYEERNNGLLLTKTLTKKLDIQAVLRELILIDSLEKVSRRKSGNTKPPKEPKKTIKRHCLLPKKKRAHKTSENSHKIDLLACNIDEHSNQSLQTYLSDTEIIISEDVNTINLNDIITFSTNVVYKDMNIIESVSFHPSAIQPVDVNVTIRHDTEETLLELPEPITQDTSLK